MALDLPFHPNYPPGSPAMTIPNRVFPQDIPETLDSLDLYPSRVAYAYRVAPGSRRIVIVLGDATVIRAYDLDQS